MSEAAVDSRLVGPVATRRRSLAPDLARGVMLLVVALVHAHMYLSDSAQVIRGYPPVARSALDSVSAALLTIFADGRSYPMFAALFGYGMGQILARRQRAGADWPSIRRLLRRRGWFLLLIGFAHVLLLFAGDILGAYGLVAVVFVGMTRASDRKLLVTAAVGIVVGSLVYALSLFLTATSSSGGGETGSALFMVANPLLDALYRIVGWPFTTPMFAIASVGPFLVGVWAARRRLLEEPARRRRLLRWTAWVGITVTVVGGLPLALMTSRVWADASPTETLVWDVVHTLTGYAGGFGYAAAVALLAIRLDGRRGRVTNAIAACGQRSMTSYLSQSVVWVVAFAPYTLDLGRRLSVFGSAVVALGAWLGAVLACQLMSRANVRGPAESLLRRLTYGAQSTAQPLTAQPQRAGGEESSGVGNV